MPKLLLIDDDQELCELLSSYLQAEGFDVSICNSGKDGVQKLRQQSFDLLVLDVMMPELNGLDLLKQLREFITTPVLMLTAKGDPVDRILGLELGADDYLAKPCNPRELLARIRAILRRTETQVLAPIAPSLQVGEILLNKGTRSGTFSSTKLELTGAEFVVLELLVKSAGEIISKDTMTEQALGRKLTAYDRSIDVHVSNIRKKIMAAGGDKDLIINIRGAGYMLTVDETA